MYDNYPSIQLNESKFDENEEESTYMNINDNKLEETNEFIKEKDYCIRRTLKKLKDYIRNSNKKSYFLTISFICIITFICITTIAFHFLIPKSSIITKKNSIWYKNEIIYEINVPMFRDSNQDGIGDFKGIIEKLNYFKKNNIQTILLQSSIFNISNELFEICDRQYAEIKTTNLLKFDPHIGNDNDFNNLIEILNKKNMHLIIDLPLSTTNDHKDLSWYGSNNLSSIKIENPCLRNKKDFGCNYYKIFKQLPLDFSNKEIANIAESRLRYWLLNKNIDGVRVNLPLVFNRINKTYSISFEIINQWKILIKNIEKKTKPKLLLFEFPSNLQMIINNQSLNEQIIYSRFLPQFIEKQRLNKFQLINSFEKNHLFLQMGSSQEHFRLGMMHDLSQRIFFTIGMLIGGTPIVLYGDELGIKQKNNPWMPWTSDYPYGGFSSCLSEKCKDILSSYDTDLLQTNVKNQELNDNIDNESLLIFFRRLSKLRKHESFQNGNLKIGYESKLDILWFIREAYGHRGFIIIIHFDRFKTKPIENSLKNLTNQQIPKKIYYGYQSPREYQSSTYLDKISIYPGSVNIFWWPSRNV